MPNLKAVEFGFNRYCGPSVLSILTGRSTDDCANAIAEVTGTYSVTAVYTKDLLEAARRMGFKSTNMGLTEISMYRALVSIAPRGNGLYIVSTETHYVCIEVENGNISFCDNHTREPIPAASSARLMTPIVSVYRVDKDENYVEPPPKKKPEPVVEVDRPEFSIVMYYECAECGRTTPDKLHWHTCRWFKDGNQS
jgi:hypothetical protein